MRDLDAERKSLESHGYAVESIKPAFRQGWVAVTQRDGQRARWIVRGPEFASYHPLRDDGR